MNHDYLDPMTGHGPFRWDPAASRRDILFISTDMVPPEFYAGYEDFPELHTPNLNALKSNGIEFGNAFASSPLCTPSRASYLTGRYSYITTNSERAHDGHAIHLRESDTIFPEYLRRIGYHTRHCGKSHVGTHKFLDAFGENDSPWDRWSPPWFDDDDYLAYLNSFGLSRFSFKRSVQGRSPDGGETGNHYGGWVAEQEKPFPKEATYPFFLVDRAIRALKARPDNGAPLYLQLDFFGPHQPFAIPAGLEARERELREQLQLPQSYRDLLESGFQPSEAEPRIYRMYRRNWGLTDPETMLDYMVANALQFELIDEALGRLFSHLKENNSFDDSWLFFIADHGEMNGEGALIDKGAYLNPQVMRVPVIMKPPRSEGIPAGRVETPVSLVDLAPTFLEIAGIETSELRDGVSLLHTLEKQSRPDGSPVLFEIWSHVMPNPSVGFVFRSDEDGRLYLFTYNATDDIDELYRLERRRGLNNLFTSQDHAAIVEEAVRKLYEILLREPRFRSYRSFIELEYPQLLSGDGGDRQHFV